MSPEGRHEDYLYNSVIEGTDGGNVVLIWSHCPHAAASCLFPCRCSLDQAQHPAGETASTGQARQVAKLAHCADRVSLTDRDGK